MSTKVLIVFAICVAVCCAQKGSGGSVSEDQLVDALSDRRYLMRQLKCAIGEAPCDSVGKRLKSLAPFVLRGSCPRCTPDDQKLIQRTLLFVQKNYPKEWNRLLQTYTG